MSELVKWEGRPTKLNKEFIEALDTVISQPKNILLTQEELIDEVNFHLEPAQQIHYKTFQDWRNNNYVPKQLDEETLSAFSSVLKKMKRLHKQAIAEGMLSEGAGSWQKFGWIAERMHTELNLTHKVDHTSDGKPFQKINIIPPKLNEADEAEYVELDNDSTMDDN